MENIKHFFGVDLTTSSIRTLSSEDSGEILYPYKYVAITVDEVHFCPFCGKSVQEFECDCKDFVKSFEKLQNSYGDTKHESCFHRSDFDFKIKLSKPISEFKIKNLTKEEILDLGFDVWDYATRHSDYLSNKSYLITPATQDDKNLFFLCKDLNSKRVYRFEILTPDYKDKQVYLGIYEQKMVSNTGGLVKRKIGNYHFEHSWRNLVKFEDWNDVCKALKKLWNFIHFLLAIGYSPIAIFILIQMYLVCNFFWNLPNFLANSIVSFK